MGAVHDWYRTLDWDEAAKADFEQRLGRARQSSRAQYIAMKAFALQRAGRLDDAGQLYLRMLAEYPDDHRERSVLEHLADIDCQQGRPEDAERGYRRALAHPEANFLGSGMVEVSLAEVLIKLDRPGEAKEVLDAVGESEGAMQTVTAFHANFFRFHLARARVAALLGNDEAAVDAARLALSVVGAPDQYSSHPGVGAVHADEQTLSELHALVP